MSNSSLSSLSSGSMEFDRELYALRYRFWGFRYSLRGPAGFGPSEIIREQASNFAYPKEGKYQTKKSTKSPIKDKNGLYKML